MTQLFRITNEAETAQIAITKTYQSLPFQEGKYFFPTPEQGANLAGLFNKSPSFAGNYSLTSGFVPTTLIEQFIPITNAGEGAGFFVPKDLLSQFYNICIHGPVP